MGYQLDKVIHDNVPYVTPSALVTPQDMQLV